MHSKALEKIRKRKQRERKEAKRSGFTPGQTPSALPPADELKIPELPDFPPLELPAIGVSSASSRRRNDSAIEPSPLHSHRSRTRSHVSIHRQSPSPPHSLPSSQRSSIVEEGEESGRLGRDLARSWRARLSSSSSARR